ncbi:hypothetical protein SAMN04489727_7748 [Amycolatopsis tolypomycina]|uniref:Peptidase inhibitor family I36 n=1 Tax=Amycolatopsis tolypomycina TaxID=208445 RepID=A0A1H5AEJ8_9PSEU|nr:hypothetical protein [Amycolatopsis tolypomycina]SED40793.1 hypothetical protein SAMN04489727_7748 [Amycolatopsis tolypomycina]
MLVESMVLRAIPMSVLALAVVAGPGAASTSAVPREFAVQGTSAGLTSAQITTLQSRTERYLAVMGGRQTGLNKIDLDGKGTVSIALPGEAHPRNLPGTTSDYCGWLTGAPYGRFCAYSGTWYTGDSIDMYYCDRYTIGFSGPGSWDNNQSTGTRARMYNNVNRVVYTTPPAASHDRDGNWTGIAYVRNC